MKRDYSKLPVKLTLTNNTDQDINIDLRDTFIQIIVSIPKNESVDINVSTSEDLAIAIARAQELNIETSFEQVEPIPEEPTEVSSVSGIKEAIAEGKTDVKLTKSITVNSGNLDLTGLTHFDGNNKTITFKSTGQNLVSTTNGAKIENVIVNNTVADENWSSTYGIQVYNGTYTIKNCTAKGCNAGILVNSANVTLEGTIDVSYNTFGGIEVSKSSSPDMPNSTLNINGATVVNTTEAYSKPTIWTDGEGQTVNGAESLFTNSEVKENQVQYYLVEANSQPNGILVNGVVYNTLSDAINAVPDNVETTVTLYKDVIVEGESLEIPETKNIILDLNEHTISSENFTANGRVLTNAGTLTVKGNGIITAASQGTKGTGAINNDGTLIIENGTFNGGDGANGAVVNNRAGAMMTVNGGTFNGCPRGIQNLATLTINDGTFIGSDTYSGNEGNAVICGPNSNATIKGGTFTGHMNGISVMDNAKATVKIEDGVFKSDGSENSGAIYNGLGNTITIDNCQAITEGDSGCTFVNKGIATVNGGTFQGDNTNAQVYTVDSGQGASSNASIELGPNVSAYGTFGALRITSGTATVKGGTYKVTESNGTPYYALYVSSASGNVTVDVENGTFESLNTAVVCGESLYTKACQLNIENGTFTSPSDKQVIKQEDPGVITLTGGSYSNSVQDFIAEGYEENEVEGRFIVSQVS